MNASETSPTRPGAGRPGAGLGTAPSTTAAAVDASPPGSLFRVRSFSGRELSADWLAALPGPVITVVVGFMCVALGLSAAWKGEPSEIATGFWPPAGAALVAFLVVPVRRWAWVVGGVLVPTAVGLAGGFMPLTAGLWWAAGNCAEPVLAALVLRRFVRSSPFSSGRLLVVFVAVAVVAAPMVGASIGAIGTVLDYGDPWSDAWIEWVMADALGVLVIVPFLISYAPRGIPRRTVGERIALCVLVAATTALGFIHIGPDASALIPYLMLVGLIWAGMRFGIRAAAAAGFVVAMGANIATSFDLGPFATEFSTVQTITLPFFIAIALVTSFLVASMASELADRDEVRRLLTHQATHDSLTGLPNRTLFHQRLDLALGALPTGDAGASAVAVLMVDLDHFKKINDRYGHSVGDLALRSAAQRMTECVDEHLLARLGGDEFVVLIADDDSDADRAAAQLARRLVQAFERRIDLDDHQFQLGCSVGIALARSDDHLAATDVLHRADLALYHVKSEAGLHVSQFDDVIEARTRRSVEIAEELRGSIDRGELRVEFQPVVSLSTGRVSEFEALTRWTNRRLGVVTPDEFIAVAEDTGFVSRLGDWVLEAACSQLADWHRALSSTELRVAVNVSARQLSDVAFPSRVRSILHRTEVPPGAVTLEITETALMDDAIVSAEVLSGLRALGVRLSMDDFGTGYSSMSNLRTTPLDVLKIDRSFVDGLGRIDTDTAIVESIIHLARSFGLEVVAEGVETPSQLEHLVRLGCQHGQGYLWSSSLDAAGAAPWLTRIVDLPEPRDPGSEHPLFASI